MSQRDVYHQAVIRILMSSGWTITHDPFVLSFGRHSLYVDLGAELPIAAEKSGRKIAVEIKSFIGTSEMTDLERALGQFHFYRFLLRRKDPDRELFLAIPVDAHMSLFEESPGRELIQETALKLIVFDIKQERIDRWID